MAQRHEEEPTLSPEAQRVLDDMIREARAMGDPNPKVTPGDIQLAKELAKRIPPEKPLAKIINFPDRHR